MEQMKMKKLASKFEEATRLKSTAITLMKANGDFIEFMDLNVLKQDPQFTAELILSASYGHPCEALRSAINDDRFLIEVAKYIILKSPNDLNWVVEHMFKNDENIYGFLSEYINENTSENTFDGEGRKTL